MKHEFLPHRKIELIYNGIDVDFFRKEDFSKLRSEFEDHEISDEIFIGIVGRLKKYKRPDHAIEAFKIVKREIPDAKLWVVGNGEMKKKLKKIACDGIKFFGWVSEKKKLELISSANPKYEDLSVNWNIRYSKTSAQVWS